LIAEKERQLKQIEIMLLELSETKK